MFTKRSTADVKKSTGKIQDSKKDSATRLRHIKTVLEHVDIEEAKSLFETNYSHVYYVLYDTFIQAESNLRQRELSFHIVHKAHREELDGSLWLLGKILCLLPELIAKRWQCHSLGRVMAKLLHHGNSAKLRREGVRYFLLWYQSLAENAPAHVHAMFNELVPGLTVPQKGSIGSSETDFNAIADLMSHPNMKGEIGASVFHDTGVHQVRAPEISPLLPPASNERSAAPDPKDGLEVLLECMVQATGCLKWRDDTPQKHMKGFAFLLQRFRDVYLPVFCPNFDTFTSVYEPRLDLPVMRMISKREEVMSSCVVVLINWVAKYTRKIANNRFDPMHLEDDVTEYASLLLNLRHMGYSQSYLARDVLYATRENVNFVNEVYRQAFLLGFASKSQIGATRTAIAVYKEWMSSSPPPFFLEPVEVAAAGLPAVGNNDSAHPRSQRLRTDSYLGAISKENLVIRAGLQNVLQTFVTHAANVFMVQTAYLNVVFQSKSRDSTPLDEQTDICKSVLNIYRTMVMNTRMEGRTWEQLLLVLLQITAVILSQVPPNSKRNNLGGRLAQPVFQTLIVTWIRAHTNVPVNITLWEKFLNVLSSLTHREELIIEWDKTMQTLTRVMARQVYNLNLQDLPLDRLAEAKGKRRRAGVAGVSGGSVWQQGSIGGSSAAGGGGGGNDSSGGSAGGGSGAILKSTKSSEQAGPGGQQRNSVPGTPSLNRSYSEGSLAPFRKSRPRKRLKSTSSSTKVPTLPRNVEHSLNRMMSSTPVHLSISSETLNNSKISQSGNAGSCGTFRRAISLDSIRQNQETEESESARGSRTPSPTASSGIDGGSIKDSPMQIDVMASDANSIDAHDDGESITSADRRSILMGGTARGWLPDVAAVMWKRMLGALGDVNKILNPKLHAQVFKHLVDITESLLKIRLNQGISTDNMTTPSLPSLVPPIFIVTPWCYGALALESQYREGKLWALQLLCTIARHGPPFGHEQLPLFYHALHQALTGEDRGMSYTALRYLGGPRFLSLLLPGHSLLLLDLVHASTVILTSFETSHHTPRADAAGLLGSLLCFPKTSLPKPVLQPSEPNVELMECPDLQEHILNVVLRCARRESTSKARCIAISSLGQWILQNLTNPGVSAHPRALFTQSITQRTKSGSPTSSSNILVNPRLKEAIQVILQALQFKHRTIARVAAETLKLCAEKGKQIARIDRLPQLIINAICIALEIQNVSHPKDSDKVVLNALLLCLGEFCMAMPAKMLVQPASNDSDETLIGNVLRILHQIATGTHTDRIKLFTADEDFDMAISVDDVKVKPVEASYQTSDTTQSCVAAIRLCAKTVAMHLVTNLSHFPMGIGATRLSSIVDEQDDMLSSNTVCESSTTRDSLDLGAAQVLSAAHLQMFLLNPALVASFIELPALKLPGGGITAGLVTASKQVRVLLRDLNGKACWDVSILYKEPRLTEATARNSKDDDRSGHKMGVGSPYEKQQFFSGEKSFIPSAVKQPLFQSGRSFIIGASLDPMISTIGMPMNPLRHTMRHRPPHQLPVAKDVAPDLDQLDDLLQYIGHTSPECLEANCSQLNTSGPTPMGSQLEAQTISIILNQRAIEHDYVTRQHTSQPPPPPAPPISSALHHSASPHLPSGGVSSAIDGSGDGNSTTTRPILSANRTDLPFHYCRLLFSQLGLAGWERRKRTHLLKRTEKLLREMRNLDTQRCRETHKMAVIYVASGQEDKHSILRNSCGSGTYEMFVSALGWEVELESHNGFLGGLPRQGCGSTSPYYATPFLEVIYHVATRMPCDTPESTLNKTRHLGNDEVHIVWSEHQRDYRRDILPTEFCDILIVVYPLKSGLFRVTVNRKPEVPWFGPLSDETIVGGACLASLVRATAINASRAKRTSLPFYQQFYEERKRSLETVASRHKDSTTYEEFTARIFSPIPLPNSNTSLTHGGSAVLGGAPLASALIDHHHRSSTKSWHQHPEVTASAREISQQTLAMTTIALDHPSPRTHRKLTHPFKSAPKSSKHNTPPDSPTLPARKFK